MAIYGTITIETKTASQFASFCFWSLYAAKFNLNRVVRYFRTLINSIQICYHAWPERKICQTSITYGQLLCRTSVPTPFQGERLPILGINSLQETLSLSEIVWRLVRTNTNTKLALKASGWWSPSTFFFHLILNVTNFLLGRDHSFQLGRCNDDKRSFVWKKNKKSYSHEQIHWFLSGPWSLFFHEEWVKKSVQGSPENQS